MNLSKKMRFYTNSLLILGAFVFFNNTNAQLKPIYSEKQLSIDSSNASTDGPYIFYKDGKAIVKQIKMKNHQAVAETKIYSKSIAGKKFKALVNEKSSFLFKIRENFTNQPAEYSTNEKIIAISDIEGNFEQFRNFLINNKVIDKNNRWIFGKGHLVTLGDFFDRGLLVTPTLWLIYSLEEQAEKYGGKVHFILGNHDIMNMSNDFRYVRKKYLENAKLIDEQYIDLYKPNTELGRWLGTKNIIEKINGYIFVHAGISREIAELDLSISELNNYARKYYFNQLKARKDNDKIANIIYNGDTSPTWYRGMGKEEISNDDLNLVSKKFKAEKFVIGHTLHQEVTYLLGGCVIDLDVHHAKGIAQGLLVEDGKEYMVNILGEKLPIKYNAKKMKDN